MAYQPNIPLATDRLRVSQGDLNGNFQNAGGSGGLGTMLNPNEGLCQFPVQGGTPTISANTPGLYCKNFATSTFNELWVQNSQGEEIPMTAGVLSEFSNSYGWAYEPSGLLKNWGFIFNIANGTNINYLTAFTTAVYQVQLTPTANFTCWPTNNNIAHFVFNYSGGAPTQSAFFLAIGV